MFYIKKLLFISGFLFLQPVFADFVAYRNPEDASILRFKIEGKVSKESPKTAIDAAFIMISQSLGAVGCNDIKILSNQDPQVTESGFAKYDVLVSSSNCRFPTSKPEYFRDENGTAWSIASSRTSIPECENGETLEVMNDFLLLPPDSDLYKYDDPSQAYVCKLKQ